VNVQSNVGWVLGGWGVASLDNVKNFGPHNYGTGNRGMQNFGVNNFGSLNFGSNNTGSNNIGNWNFGDGNCGSNNVGDGNVGSNNVGDFNAGNLNVGLCNTGNGTSGLLNFGNLVVGFANSAAGSSVLGYNNTNVGTGVMGLGNSGLATSSTFNTTSSFLIGNKMNGVTGTNNIGYLTSGNAPSSSNTIGYGNSSGNGNIGFFNVGSTNVGSFNYGTRNIGNLNGVQSFSLTSTKSGLPRDDVDYVDLLGVVDQPLPNSEDSASSPKADDTFLSTHFHTGLSPFSTVFTLYDFSGVTIAAVNTTLLSTNALGWSNVNASNCGAGNAGWQETGFGNLGYNNTGQANNGYMNIGISNAGGYNINNSGSNGTFDTIITPITYSTGTFPSLLACALDGYQDAQAANYPNLFNVYSQPLIGALTTYSESQTAPCTRANATCAALPMTDVTSNVFSVGLNCRGSIKITDLYCSGDSYAIFKDGLLWMTTPILPPNSDPMCLNPITDPEEAFYSDRFSHVVGYLPQGRYNIVVRPLVTNYGGGGVAIKADDFCDARDSY